MSFPISCCRPRAISSLLLGLFLAAGIPAQATETDLSAIPATQRLQAAYQLRQLAQLRRWFPAFSAKAGRAPVSLRDLLRHPADPTAGIAWIWLAQANLVEDYEYQTHFSSGEWSIAGRPKEGPPGLALFASSDNQQVHGQWGPLQFGHSALPTINPIALESSLGASLMGPSDLDALIDALEILDAQKVFFHRKKSYACTMEELHKSTAGGQRLMHLDRIQGRSNLKYQISGQKFGRSCNTFVLQLTSDRPSLPSYEAGADGRIFVIPTWGNKRGLRIPLDGWKAEF